MEITVTFFKGLRSTKPVKTLFLSEVLNDIKNGRWKSQYEKCQNDISYKDRLECFTPTGIFNHRSIAGHEIYNGVICLDIDHVEKPEELKELASKLPWVHAAFITPSGKGLKVIVLTNATKENYKVIEEAIAHKFNISTGFSRDNHCKDIARIQYISYDPNVYYNSESEILTF